MSNAPSLSADPAAAIASIREARSRIAAELSKVIIGQSEVVDALIVTLLARGHALVEGAPGLGKTLLVKSLAQIFSLHFRRIQFTPDLMPADIVGSEVVEEDPVTGHRSFRFVPGPIFTQILLADEINRTPPKTQSALLEAMEERHVTAAGQTHPLAQPFFVLATQNPIELEGTYPLPEAQLDRFLMKIVIGYLTREQEADMVAATTAPPSAPPSAIFQASEILALQSLVRSAPAPRNVIAHAVALAAGSRPTDPAAPKLVRERVKFGAGSRASQSLILAAKARALLDGRLNPAIEDVRALAHPVLRHRIIPNFQAEAENLTTEDIITELLKSTPA